MKSTIFAAFALIANILYILWVLEMPFAVYAVGLVISGYFSLAGYFRAYRYVLNTSELLTDSCSDRTFELRVSETGRTCGIPGIWGRSDLIMINRLTLETFPSLVDSLVDHELGHIRLRHVWVFNLVRCISLSILLEVLTWNVIFPVIDRGKRLPSKTKAFAFLIFCVLVSIVSFSFGAKELGFYAAWFVLLKYFDAGIRYLQECDADDYCASKSEENLKNLRSYLTIQNFFASPYTFLGIPLRFPVTSHPSYEKRISRLTKGLRS
ncbi:MAG TPA: M48 family metalloprotease [Patescibacteria group bacterium]|nr:M48 family metalloprotease [Patescibacteria group bacterium]